MIFHEILIVPSIGKWNSKKNLTYRRITRDRYKFSYQEQFNVTIICFYTLYDYIINIYFVIVPFVLWSKLQKQIHSYKCRPVLALKQWNRCLWRYYADIIDNSCMLLMSVKITNSDTSLGFVWFDSSSFDNVKNYLYFNDVYWNIIFISEREQRKRISGLNIDFIDTY